MLGKTARGVKLILSSRAANLLSITSAFNASFSLDWKNLCALKKTSSSHAFISTLEPFLLRELDSVATCSIRRPAKGFRILAPMRMAASRFIKKLLLSGIGHMRPILASVILLLFSQVSRSVVSVNTHEFLRRGSMDRQNDCEESIENDDLDDDRSNDDFDCDEPEARLVFPKVSTGNGPTINIVPGDAEQSVQTAERTTAPDFVVAELGEIIAENERNKSQSEDLAMEVLGVNNESNDKVDRFVETELGAAKEAKSGAEEAKTLESYERLRHKAKMNSLEHDRLDSEEHDHQEGKVERIR